MLCQEQKDKKKELLKFKKGINCSISVASGLDDLLKHDGHLKNLWFTTSSNVALPPGAIIYCVFFNVTCPTALLRPFES